MTALPQSRRVISVEEYLAEEAASEVRREYIAGEVHAMGGGSAVHNIICGNLFASLHASLRRGPCQVFMADMKVHLNIAGEDLFYYPDLLVACDPADNAAFYRERPAIVVEVLSPTTERVDRREKFLAYRELPSLENYVLIEQERIGCIVFRRRNKWQPEPVAGPERDLVFDRIEFRLPLAELYARTPLRASPPH